MSSGSDGEQEYVERPPAQLRDHVCIFGDVYLPEDDMVLELRNAANQPVLAFDAVTEEHVSLVVVSAEMKDRPKHIRCTFSYEQKQQSRPARFPAAADIRYDFTVYDTRATLVLDTGRVLIIRASSIINAALAAAPPSQRLVTPPRSNRPVRRRQTITPVKRETDIPEEEKEEDDGDTAPLSAVTQRLSNVSVGTQVLQEEEDQDATQQLFTPPRRSMGPPPPRSVVRASPARVDDMRLPTPPRPAVPWPPNVGNPVAGRKRWVPFAPSLGSLEEFLRPPPPPVEVDDGENEEEKKPKKTRRRKNRRFNG